jgi:hypothetical protein
MSVSALARALASQPFGKFDTLQWGPWKEPAMLALVRRYFTYRRLRPVVVVLPGHLAKGYGPGRHYTLGQARRAIADLKLSAQATPYALAAACTLQELEKSVTADISAVDYQRMRMELADLFGLASADFTMDMLRSKVFNTHHPAPENMYAGSGGGHP